MIWGSVWIKQVPFTILSHQGVIIFFRLQPICSHWIIMPQPLGWITSMYFMLGCPWRQCEKFYTIENMVDIICWHAHIRMYLKQHWSTNSFWDYFKIYSPSKPKVDINELPLLISMSMPLKFVQYFFVTALSLHTSAWNQPSL